MTTINTEAAEILNKINAKMEEEKIKKAWDKLPNETNKAYTAFVLYLQFGTERSLQKVADYLGKSKRNIEKWSQKFNWVERINAFELERKEEAIENNIKQHHSKLSALKKQCEDTAVALHGISLMALGKLYKRLESMTVEDMNAMDAGTTINSVKNVSIISSEALDAYARSLGVGELMETVNLGQNSKLAEKR